MGFDTYGSNQKSCTHIDVDNNYFFYICMSLIYICISNKSAFVVIFRETSVNEAASNFERLYKKLPTA